MMLLLVSTLDTVLASFIHSHSFFEIIFVLNGFCSNDIGNYNLKLKKGNVCIIAPNTTHALSIFTDDCIVLNLLVRSSTFEKSFFELIKSNDILSAFFLTAYILANQNLIYYLLIKMTYIVLIML